MPLRIGVIQSTSIANPCALDFSNSTTNCATRGYGMDAALVVCQYLRLDCEFAWFNDTSYGDYSPQTGLGTGLIGAILRGEIDTSIPILTPTYSRDAAVSFSNAYFYADVVAVTRAASSDHFLSSINLNFVLTFDWATWLGIFSSLVLTCLMVSYAQGGLDHHMHRKKMLNFFETGLALLTRQYGQIETRPSSAVLQVTVWATVFIVLTSAYTGELFSQKMSTNVRPPYRDVDEMIACIERDHCRIIVSSPSASYLQNLLIPGTEVTARLTRAFEKHPMKIVRNKTELALEILNDRRTYLIWITSKNDFEYFITENKKYACSFHTLTMPYDDNCGFAVRKNETRLLRNLNLMADHFRQAGLEDIIDRKYFSSSKCAGGDSESGAGNIFVEFWEITVILYFYVAGMFVGLIGLGCEWAYDRHGLEIIDLKL